MPEFPGISVVTSCFNCERYLGTTIRSVVEQNYPNLEYIVIDGASTDGTLEVARNYADKISQLLSEPDDGQYHGIQKGLSRASGEVMAYLNADDAYFPWTLSVVGEIFRKFPEVQWLIGTPSYMNAAGQCTRISSVAGAAYPRVYIRNGWFRPSLAGYLQQESMFWRRGLWQRAGGLDLDLKYAADFDLWRRFAEHAELYSVSIPLALFRQRPGEQKSSLGADAYEEEVGQVSRGLKKPPRLWEVLGAKELIWRHVARMLIWKKACVIAYSRRKQEWVLVEKLRPLARTSFAEVILEYQNRKQSGS